MKKKGYPIGLILSDVKEEQWYRVWDTVLDMPISLFFKGGSFYIYSVKKWYYVAMPPGVMNESRWQRMPNFFTKGVKINRLSSSKPNIQMLPKEQHCNCEMTILLQSGCKCGGE